MHHHDDFADWIGAGSDEGNIWEQQDKNITGVTTDNSPLEYKNVSLNKQITKKNEKLNDDKTNNQKIERKKKINKSNVDIDDEDFTNTDHNSHPSSFSTMRTATTTTHHDNRERSSTASTTTSTTNSHPTDDLEASVTALAEVTSAAARSIFNFASKSLKNAAAVASSSASQVQGNGFVRED